jgi:hypothetical protein
VIGGKQEAEEPRAARDGMTLPNLLSFLLGCSLLGQNEDLLLKNWAATRAMAPLALGLGPPLVAAKNSAKQRILLTLIYRTTSASLQSWSK